MAEALKKLTIKDCENRKGNCPTCNNEKYKLLEIGQMCFDCATIKHY
jgi:hypothetical protein